MGPLRGPKKMGKFFPSLRDGKNLLSNFSSLRDEKFDAKFFASLRDAKNFADRFQRSRYPFV